MINTNVFFRFYWFSGTAQCRPCNKARRQTTLGRTGQSLCVIENPMTRSKPSVPTAVGTVGYISYEQHLTAKELSNPPTFPLEEKARIKDQYLSMLRRKEWPRFLNYSWDFAPVWEKEMYDNITGEVGIITDFPRPDVEFVVYWSTFKDMNQRHGPFRASHTHVLLDMQRECWCWMKFFWKMFKLDTSSWFLRTSRLSLICLFCSRLSLVCLSFVSSAACSGFPFSLPGTVPLGEACPVDAKLLDGSKDEQCLVGSVDARKLPIYVQVYVREICIIVHVGGTRCVTSSTDHYIKMHARITLSVEFIRTCIFLFLFYVWIQLRAWSTLTLFSILLISRSLSTRTIFSSSPVGSALRGSWPVGATTSPFLTARCPIPVRAWWCHVGCALLITFSTMLWKYVFWHVGFDFMFGAMTRMNTNASCCDWCSGEWTCAPCPLGAFCEGEVTWLLAQRV